MRYCKEIYKCSKCGNGVIIYVISFGTPHDDIVGVTCEKCVDINNELISTALLEETRLQDEVLLEELKITQDPSILKAMDAAFKRYMKKYRQS
jgi:hypothetical protein